MKIKELFQNEVTRDIPPVVYFHEQDPEKVKAEVSEYIITGGYPEDDPRSRRVEDGIHEGYVGLLKGIIEEWDKNNGPELPASWISGFYGSGKSSFAKLLGLALDNATLPDGKSVADALLERDDSPKRQELVDAWKDLRDIFNPMAVVFDVGAVARDNEQIHSAALRQVQARLGYCTKSDLVARWELKLEQMDQWEQFLEAAGKTLKKPWDKAKEEPLAEDHFSHVMHVMNPERYKTPVDWIDSRDGIVDDSGSAVKETIGAIEAMLTVRAADKALFLVIDEVSQYVHQDDERMLRLQSFVSELGHRLKGRVWILATGQQRLEDSGDTTSISKLKDRFPPKLRVHLGTTNIRDVVHKRLLQKASDKEDVLRELFSKHRSDLKVYGYSCEDITENDFLEVYPMLPGHVDLLLQITSNLRTRSSRVQGDDHAIRGLLQLLGELFREQKLAEGEVGELVTLDKIYEVQQSALDPDIQMAMTRILEHVDFKDDVLAQKCAKVVALLELIQEQVPTTAELVTKCLYASMGQGNKRSEVNAALERLRQMNLLGYSEKQGFKIQSSAGQEWERERREISAVPEKQSAVVQKKLAELLGLPETPRYKGNKFPWMAWYSDGRGVSDVKIKDVRGQVSIAVDFRYHTKKEDRMDKSWVARSDQDQLRNRILWVVGECGRLGEVARELIQSQSMVKKYESRYGSLPGEKKRMFVEEQTRLEDLEQRMLEGVSEAIYDGVAYFRGRSMQPRDFSGSFATALTDIGNRLLPEIYPHFTEFAITDKELGQLLDKDLSGPSTKFMEAGLGILSLDAGKYQASCSGDVPSRIFSYVEGSGASGTTLLSYFSEPPYGYPADVIKACLAGLLRAGKIRMRPDAGPEITSVRDPGTRDLFRLDTALRKSEILPARDTGIGSRDRVAICKMFSEYLQIELDRENDAIADAVFNYFPGQRKKLSEVEAHLGMVPDNELPTALIALANALENCTRSRQVEDIVIAVKRNLDALRDGFEQLGIYHAELTEQALEMMKRASRVKDHELSQLKAVEQTGEVKAAADALAKHFQGARPWRDVSAIEAPVEEIVAHYRAVRKNLIEAETTETNKVTARIKHRDGFEKLNSETEHVVLKPIERAIDDTSEDAIAPTLVAMKTAFPTRLQQAEETANDLLDAELAKLDVQPVEKVEANMRGREIKNREELNELLKELEARIGAALEKGARVRLL